LYIAELKLFTKLIDIQKKLNICPYIITGVGVVLQFYEEPKFPVLKNKLEPGIWFWVRFFKRKSDSENQT
jgi:hypothetical protein